MNSFQSTMVTLVGGVAFAAFAVVMVPAVPASLVFWATLGLIAAGYGLLTRKSSIKDNAVAAAIAFGSIALWVDFDLYARSSHVVWQLLALCGTTFVGYLLVEAVRYFPAGLSEEGSLDAAINRDSNFRTLFSPHSALPVLTGPELA